MCIAPNIRASRYMMQKWIELQRGIDKFTLIGGDFDTTLQQLIDHIGGNSVRI